MVPLFKPFIPELPKLNDILNSGKIASGEYTQLFEESLKQYFGTPYLIVTNTFSSAISVSLATYGLKFGDEVILSPMACLASTQSFLTYGLKVIWCDVDPKTGTIDPIYLDSIITDKTKLIVHNHYCGYVGNIDEVNEIGKKYNIPIMDDGIECFGSEYKGSKVGNCGTDLTVFSLSAVRIPNTIEGGIVIFKDEQLYKKSLRIRDCGIDRKKFRDDLGEINPKCDISEIGYSATMSNINAYIGYQQMKNIKNLIQIQRENAKIICNKIKDDLEIMPIKEIDSKPNYWVYGVISLNKEKTILKYRKLGFYASGVHINNNIYSVFGNQLELPGAKSFNDHFVALPSGWWVKEYSCL